MNTPLNILVADPEPLMLECISDALETVSRYSPYPEFKIHKVKDCDIAKEKIKSAVLGKPFDLAILDIRLPSSKDKNLLCGEDVAIRLKKEFPKIKIIVMTSLDHPYRVSNILHTINPEGFLIKNETDDKRLRKAIRDVLEDTPHYTGTVSRVIRSHLSTDYLLDMTDRRILMELSNGIRNNEIYKLLNISKSTLELRKVKIKDLFGLDYCGDKELIKCAKEKGFV